jgi:integrase/recombinase XerC
MAASLASFNTLVHDYAQHLHHVRRLSPRSVEAYTDALNAYKKLCLKNKVALLEVGTVTVFLRHQSKKRAEASQSLSVSALKSFLGWLAKQRPHSRLSPKLLQECVRPRVPQKMVQVIDDDSLQVLKKHVASRPLAEQFLFELLYGCGLRISEAQAFDRANVVANEGLARIRGKGRKERMVPLTPNALKIISALVEPQPLVNTHLRSLRQWVYNWAKACGLGGLVAPHKLRHSIATHLLKRGARLPQIQKLLGHKRLATTERYTHLLDADLLRVYDQSFPQLKRGSKPPQASPRLKKKLG